jgi:MFS family permease
VLVPLGVVAGMLVPPISATMRSVWMNLTTNAHVRDAAFALDAMTTQLVFALGPLVTAAIVAAAGAEAAVVASGLLTLAGTVAFASSAPIAALGPVEPRIGLSITSRRRRVGWTKALSSAPLRAVLLTVLLAGIGTGSIEVGLPALAVHLGSHALAGVLLGLWAFGAVVGGWCYGVRRWRMPVIARLRVAAAAAAVLSLPLLAADSIPVALALSLVAGLPWAAVFACQYARVGETAPKHALTEAFTWNVAAIVGGVAIGTAVGGILISRFGAASAFIEAGIATLAIVFVARDTSARQRDTV